MGLPKKLNYILLPLYQMWCKILEKFSLKNNVLLLDNKEIQGVVDVANITTIEDSVLNKLKVGDVIRKITSNQKHCYVVSYKEEEHGICLSYFDAGYTETVSYDYTEGHWVYNSTDVVPIPEEKTDAEIKALAKEEVESASSGTIQDVLGLDSGGNLIKGAVSGGTKLYKHTYNFTSLSFLYYTLIESDGVVTISKATSLVSGSVMIISNSSGKKSISDWYPPVGSQPNIMGISLKFTTYPGNFGSYVCSCNLVKYSSQYRIVTTGYGDKFGSFDVNFSYNSDTVTEL